jgi:hypothetical protein
MRRSALHSCLPVLLTLAGSAGAAASDHAKSLRFACFNEPFLSVSVSAPRHDRFVNIELGVVDPAGRKAGSGDDHDPIPRSQYGKVIQIPSNPEWGKAVAIEICGAMPGTYVITVLEHGSVDYRLSVSGDDGSGSNQGNDTEPVNLHTGGDRLCHYKFDFNMENRTVAIRWLDHAGHPLKFGERPSCDAVPRA